MKLAMFILVRQALASQSEIVFLSLTTSANKILDVKPDNILLNEGSRSSRFTEVELADCGDATWVDPKNHLKLSVDGPHMGAAIFRSPEAMIELRWGTPTDIWSFGTTVSGPNPKEELFFELPAIWN